VPQAGLLEGVRRMQSAGMDRTSVATGESNTPGRASLGLLVHRVSGRQIVLHHAQLYAGAHDVAQTVEDLTQGMPALRCVFIKVR
jgi:hypothetical protein